MFIDSNLLVLLVVGETDGEVITRHRRTRSYRAEDYDLLVRLINDTGHQVYVTPNTLTEASNPLITADLDLYLAAAAQEDGAAFNFAHYRGL